MRQYGGLRADIRKVIQGQSNLKELHKKDYCDNVNSIYLKTKNAIYLNFLLVSTMSCVILNSGRLYFLLSIQRRSSKDFS